MRVTRRRPNTPIAELSARELQKRITAARKAIERLSDRPPYAELAKHRAVMEAAVRDRATAQAELDRRAQAEQESLNAAFRRRVEAGQRSVQLKALSDSSSKRLATLGCPSASGRTP
jgi:lambda repressor-like predicted transcriptional regulator